MKALFAHCHQFVIDDLGVIRSEKLPYPTWARYLEFCDELTVVGRRRTTTDVRNYSISSGARVRFQFMDSISSLSALFGARDKARRVLRTMIAGHDFVIARLPSEYGFLAADVATELGKPCLVEVVGCAWDGMWNHGGLAARIYAPLYTFRMKRAVRRSRFASYVSQEELQARYPAADGAVVAAVSNVEIPEPDPTTLTRRLARLANTRTCVRVGLIGSLKTRYKGVHTAIEALAACGDRGRELELRVLGDGDDSSYRRLAAQLGVENRVYFDGVRATGPGVFAWLDEIDIYIQPSLQEGLPRALVEAMSRGCPAIASTAGGIPELLEPMWLFAPGNVRALSSLLLQMASNKMMMEQQARRNFMKSHDYKKAVLDSRRREILGAVQRAAATSNNRIARNS